MGEGEDLASVVDGLGESWELMQNAYKPYPCGVVLHPVIDACLELRPQVGDVARIERVMVKGHPLLRERADRPNVTTGREAQVSLQHSVAVAFLYGAAGVKEYSDACVNDPAVLALRGRVSAADDAAIPVEAARVAVELADGHTVEEYVAHGRGTPGRPMSDLELDAKIGELIAFGARFVDAPALIAAIRELETVGDAAHLLRLTVPG